MSRTVEVEYVGGPFDGRREEWTILPPELYVEEPELKAAMLAEARLPTDEEFMTSVHVYRRRPLAMIGPAPVRYDWRPR